MCVKTTSMHFSPEHWRNGSVKWTPACHMYGSALYFCKYEAQRYRHRISPSAMRQTTHTRIGGFILPNVLCKARLPDAQHFVSLGTLRKPARGSPHAVIAGPEWERFRQLRDASRSQPRNWKMQDVGRSSVMRCHWAISRALWLAEISSSMRPSPWSPSFGASGSL